VRLWSRAALLFPLVGGLILSSASAAAACERPAFTWTPDSTGGSACGGRCGLFAVPSTSFFVSQSGGEISWTAGRGYRLEGVTAKSANGRTFNSTAGDNTAVAARGDHFVSVTVRSSNCGPPIKVPKITEGDHRSPLWVIVAAFLMAGAGGSLLVFWLRENEYL